MTRTPTPAAPAPLLSKEETAVLLGVSPRTVDRWRQTHDMGEVRLTRNATPKFRRSVIEAAITAGKFALKKQRK